MKWFNNLNVAMKVFLSCLVFIVLLIVGSVFAVSSITQTEKDIDSYKADRVDCVIQCYDMYKNVLQARINMFAAMEALNANDRTEIDSRVADYRNRKAENEKLWKLYTASYMKPDEKTLADRFEKEYADMISEFEKFVSALNNNDKATAGKVLYDWKTYYNKARITMEEIIALNVREGDAMIAVNKANSSRTRLMLYILLVISLGAGALITFVLARSVSKPVAKGLAFAQKIAAGDFTERIDLDQKDELGQLGTALNTAADDLEKMVADIVVGSQNLVQAIQEISAGNENLSQRTSEQASSLEEVASTIEETTAAINQNAENAKSANGLSLKTSSMAEEGSRVVYEAVSAINEINEASKKIEEITSVINEIAFQTNLLALNAAVEAARAGEQGRGFAVVAGEVRNLAQRSGAAAKEIGALIKTTIVKVENGTALANKSGEALKEIVVAVKGVNKLVSEIDAASDEQKQGTSQINIAVSELDSMTQQNAGLVEETASASEEIANQAQDLLGTMERFKIRKEIKNESLSSKHKELHLKSSGKTAIAVKTNEKREDPSAKTAADGKTMKIEKMLSDEGFEQF
jgi:methyl-accepting chemotaxis protein